MRGFEDLYITLCRAYTSLQQEVDGFAKRHQLSVGHLEILLVANRLGASQGCIPLKALYPYFGLTQPAIGRLVRYLAYWDYMEVRRDQEDRRRMLIRILPAGQQVLRHFRELSRRCLASQDFITLHRALQGLPQLTFVEACDPLEKASAE
jgi:DNA-binding MarR family transcriptional regulator